MNGDYWPNLQTILNAIIVTYIAICVTESANSICKCQLYYVFSYLLVINSIHRYKAYWLMLNGKIWFWAKFITYIIRSRDQYRQQIEFNDIAKDWILPNKRKCKPYSYLPSHMFVPQLEPYKTFLPLSMTFSDVCAVYGDKRQIICFDLLQTSGSSSNL